MAELKQSTNSVLLFICLKRDLIILLQYYSLAEFLVHREHRTEDGHIKSRYLIFHFIFIVQQVSEMRINFLRLFSVDYNYNIWFTNINYVFQNLRNLKGCLFNFRSTCFTNFSSPDIKVRKCTVIPSAPL